MSRKNIIIVGIIVVAALLRFIGTNPGYNRYHNDEPIVYGTAIEMVENNTLDPQRFDYPGGAIYINYIFFKFGFIPARWFVYYLSHLPQIIDGTVHIPISNLETDRLFHTFVLGGREFYPLFWGRYIVALFSVGNVILLYILAKNLFGKSVGLVSAFLLAVNFRQVLNSHIDLPDIYNAFFLLLSCVFAFAIWKNPSKKNYLLAGIAAGLSFSMKYQVFGFLPIFIAHIYVSYESKSFFKTIINRKTFLTAFSSALTFLIFNPYFFAHFETAKMWIESVSQRYGTGANTLNFFPLSYLFHYDYGAPEFILAGIGILYSFWKFPKKTILIFSAITPFMIFFLYLSRGGFYIRNFVTITPLILIFPAIVLVAIHSFIKSRTNRLISIGVFLAILFLVTLVPIRNSILNTYYYTKPWDYNVLSEWLFKNFTKGEVIAANPFDPPTGSPELKKTEFELSGSYSLAEHKEDGASYALSNSDWTANPFFFWMSYGLPDLVRFWNKPVDILRNTFYGLAIEEHFRYQIFTVAKSWQAPDEVLVLAKIPVWPQVKFKNIVNYNFDKGIGNWKLYGKENGSTANYVFDANTGFKGYGSISFTSSDTRYSTVRLSSEPINVNPGHLYKITGYLKSEKDLSSRERSGFIRIDFYSDNDFEKVGMISAISSRLYGVNSWTRKEITERAPEGARYLVVSFQMSNTISDKIRFDDISVDESTEIVEDITSKPPYTRKKIDLDLLYTNSHANL